jgi:hypothetical protein
VPYRHEITTGCAGDVAAIVPVAIPCRFGIDSPQAAEALTGK